MFDSNWVSSRSGFAARPPAPRTPTADLLQLGRLTHGVPVPPAVAAAELFSGLRQRNSLNDEATRRGWRYWRRQSIAPICVEQPNVVDAVIAVNWRVVGADVSRIGVRTTRCVVAAANIGTSRRPRHCAPPRRFRG